MLTTLAAEVAQQVYPVGALYVVATPIGNIGDISVRALHLLHEVDAIACEDTRNTAQLLNRYGLSKPLIAAHEHNEREVGANIVARLHAGERIALVSDAGTPGVSDPGARIVDLVLAAGLRVMPLPGASAVACAMSVAGFPKTEFRFVGFLPAKSKQRDDILRALVSETACLVFYEAPHRIRDTVAALLDAMGPERAIVFGRELSKLFEQVHRCRLDQALDWLDADPHHQRGEFVLVLDGAQIADDDDEQESRRVLQILLAHCSVKDAANMAAQITGQKKNRLYDLALTLAQDGRRD